MHSGTTTREEAVKMRKQANPCAEAHVTLTYFRLKNTDHTDCRLQTVNRPCRVCRLSVIFIYLYLNFSRWTLIEVINTSFPLLVVTPPCIIYVTQRRGVWPGLSIVPISWFATTWQGHHVGGSILEEFTWIPEERNDLVLLKVLKSLLNIQVKIHTYIYMFKIIS